MSPDNETALQAYKEEVWAKRMNHSKKTRINKSLTGLLHGLEVFGLGLISMYTRNNCLWIGVPAFIAINSLIMKKLDNMDTQYWRENWHEPFAVHNQRASEAIIEVKAKDIS